MKKADCKLSPATREWINTITRDYVLEDRHLTVLNMAGQAMDRLEAIREVLSAEGVTMVGRGDQSVAHPLLAEERAQMRAFTALIRELGLDLEQTETPRKPRI